MVWCHFGENWKLRSTGSRVTPYKASSSLLAHFWPPQFRDCRVRNQRPYGLSYILKTPPLSMSRGICGISAKAGLRRFFVARRRPIRMPPGGMTAAIRQDPFHQPLRSLDQALRDRAIPNGPGLLPYRLRDQLSSHRMVRAIHWVGLFSL